MSESEALRLHEQSRGKLAVQSKVPLRNRKDLSLAYTPGVAEVSLAVAKNAEDAYRYTSKGNFVAVVSDGSAVLGLGDIGPAGAIPVMEGKAVLFKALAGVDAFPICLDVHSAEEIISVVRAIAPVFGGINLEDIAAPKCFEVESRLKALLDIPVMHDDQHGTAVVVLAGIINALKVVGKKKGSIRVVVSGAGAAGTATAKMLLNYGIRDLVMVDSRGIVSKDRDDLNGMKKEIVAVTNPRGINGSLADAVKGADVFIGVSKAGLLSSTMVRSMAKDAIVFAMANPVPEIMPDEARQAGARVVATGRSDFPNQINNSLGFPGIFRGTLDVRAREINEEMKLAAAEALAALVKSPTAEQIIPEPLDREVPKAVAAAVAAAARKTGTAKIS